MELAVFTPLACAALDTALDASAGGGMAVLACGSGKKLKMALKHRVRPNHFSPAKPAMGRPQLLTETPGNTQRALQLPFQQAGSYQYLSSLVPASNRELADVTRPSLDQHSLLPNPRSRRACMKGEAKWLCDPGGILSIDDADALQQALDLINARTGVQLAAVMLNDVQGSCDINRFRQFGVELFNTWGVGSVEHNDGVLLIFFKDARRLEIVTGTGMSKVIPDSWLLHMQITQMVPHFKVGAHSRGLQEGVRAIEERLHMEAPPGETPSELAQFAGGGADPSNSQGGQSNTTDQSSSRGEPRWVSWDTVGLYTLIGLAWLNEAVDFKDWQLTNRILELESAKELKFVDAGGTNRPWPYLTAPTEMVGLTELVNRPPSHVYRLIKEGRLDVSAKGDRFGNNSLELTLTNHSEEDLEVHLPAGSLFVAITEHRQQPLLLQSPTQVTLKPLEKQSLHLNTFCGDRGAHVPFQVDMVLSPYELSEEHLGGQSAVWRWAAKHQRASTELPCSGADDILRESFGIVDEQLSDLCSELNQLLREGQAQRARELSRTKEELTRHRADRERQRRASRSSGSRDSFGGGSSGFGGGCTTGGGSGCSW